MFSFTQCFTILCRTTVAVAGKDFVMVGSDTRLAGRAAILSRQQTKVFPLTANTVIASTGCWADVLALNKDLQARLTVSTHCL